MQAQVLDIAANFIISRHGSLGPGHQSHDRAARSARPFRVRHRPDRAHAAESLRESLRLRRPPSRGRDPLDLQPHRDLLRRRARDARPHGRTGWPQIGGVSPALLRSHAYTLHDDQAARHAFRVASGLDSMVLGEAQILGQMKDAVRAADQAGALGTTLNQLFQRSFAVAKEVRTSTEIGAHSISMAAAAVRLAGQLFEDLGKTRVLFVGAGEMIELAATHFAAKQPQAHRHRQPHAGARRKAGLALRRRGDAAGRPARAPARVRRRGQLHRQHPAASSAWAPSSARSRRASTGRCSWSTWRCRATSSPRSRRWKTSTSTPSTTWPSVVQTGQANRQAAVAQAEAIIDAGVQSFMHWLDQRGTRAADPAAQRADRRVARRGTGPRPQAAGQGRGRRRGAGGPVARPHAEDAARRHGRAACRRRRRARATRSTAIQHFFLRKER